MGRKDGAGPLARIEPSSIKVSEIDKSESGLDLRISFGYEDYDPNDLIGKQPPGFTGISCKDRRACEQMAADLTKLVEIIGC